MTIQRKNRLRLLGTIMLVLSVSMNTQLVAGWSWNSENTWIYPDYPLTGRTGLSFLRSTDILNLGAYVYGGMWGSDTGAVQITIDTLRGGDTFYANRYEMLTVTFKWKFNGYHDSRNSGDSIFRIGYAVTDVAVPLENVVSRWIWNAPVNVKTTWNNQIVQHTYSYRIPYEGEFRFAIALNFYQDNGFLYSGKATDFFFSGREIELQAIILSGV